jgi:hypothetical protein
LLVAALTSGAVSAQALVDISAAEITTEVSPPVILGASNCGSGTMFVSLTGGLPGFTYVVYEAVPGPFYLSVLGSGPVSPNSDGITRIEVIDPRPAGASSIAAVLNQGFIPFSQFSPLYNLRAPTSLPKPEIAPTPVWACGLATGIRGHQPGDEVKLFSGPATRFTIPIANGSFDYTPAGSPGPFAAGETLFANYRTCEATRSGVSQNSPLSDPVFVGTFSGTLAVPRLVPNSILPGSSSLVVENVAHGALVTFEHIRSGSSKVWSYACAMDPCAVGLGSSMAPFMAGDELRASQQLCPGSGSSTTAFTVNDCADVPPPTIATPTVGADTITLLSYSPDAEIVVYAAKNATAPFGTLTLIGRGAASARVGLFRPIIAADKAIIVGQLNGTCGKGSGYAFVVAD